MLENIKNSPLLHIFMVVIALIGIYPILHDWLYKSVDLTIEVKSEAVVISKSLPIDNLNLLYKGKNIDALNKVVLELSNSGKTPITNLDVIVPLLISFKNSDILEAKITKVSPSNLEVSVLKENARDLKLLFSLLNPQDKVYVDILLLGTDSSFDAQARIKNLDKVSITYSSHQKSTDSDWYFFSVLTSFVCGLMFLLVVVIELPKSFKRLKVIKALVEGRLSYSNALTKLEAFRLLDAELNNIPDKIKLRIWEIIGQETFPLSVEAKVDTLARVSLIQELDKSKFLIDLVGTLITLFILGILLTVGFYPVLVSFFLKLTE